MRAGPICKDLHLDNTVQLMMVGTLQVTGVCIIQVVKTVVGLVGIGHFP